MTGAPAARGTGESTEGTAAFREDVLARRHDGAQCGGGDDLEPRGAGLTAGVTAVICTYRRPESLLRAVRSLAAQTAPPQRLVVVDASPDAATEEALRADPRVASAAGCVVYLRVTGRLKGLTRQRNFALRFVGTDLVAFFDDDVVLQPDCLAEMERAHRTAPDAVGIGAFVENEPEPSAFWRVRRALGIVPHLAAGRYTRTGMSIPWGFLRGEDSKAALVEGDWLPGCGMMWTTEAARELLFHEPFEGYAQGEDLDFSLRARRRGKLYLAREARLAHLQEPAGRPDDFRLGYAAIFNRFEIHRRAFPERRPADVAAFVYAWTLDTLLLLRGLVVPGRAARTGRHVAGRLAATRDIVFRRPPTGPETSTGGSA